MKDASSDTNPLGIPYLLIVTQYLLSGEARGLETLKSFLMLPSDMDPSIHTTILADHVVDCY